MLSSLSGARSAAAAARGGGSGGGGALASSSSGSGPAALAARSAPLALPALSARRRSNAAACSSGRAAAPAAAPARGPALRSRRPRGAAVAAGAKRKSRGATGSGGGEAPEEDLAEDVLFQDDAAGGNADEAGGGGEEGELDAFDGFSIDDDPVGEDEDEDEDGDGEGGGGEEGEELEGWDAALTQFDEAQDAKARRCPPRALLPDFTPSPEELLLAEQRRIGRVDPTTMDVEIEDVTPKPAAPRTEEDRLTALSVADAARLTGNRAGYTSFKMDGCDLLVAETADGLYDLQDSFVFDEKSDLFNRCATGENLPAAAARFQCIPWAELGTGDMLKFKDKSSKVLKMYFVGVESTTPEYKVDMESLFVFDTASRVLSCAPVTRVHDEIQEPILRIRPEGITIECALRAPPTWRVLAEQYWHNPMPAEDELGYDPSKHGPEAKAAELAAFGGGVAAAAAAFAAAGGEFVRTDMDDLPEGLDDVYVEDLPDVPAVDMM
ncbi:MAG: hypothetical protein J3K34DRAFT_477295 [Monoraphidium minutum]|nr:MAG: hypothetical protein J3K34DRAFT_477295 [Monoraphidium minutum]